MIAGGALCVGPDDLTFSTFLRENIWPQQESTAAQVIPRF